MIQVMFFTLALLAGASIALQTGINSELRGGLGNSLQAGFVSFAVGTVALAIVAIPQSRWNATNMANLPWWIWTGGLLGAFLVTSLIFLAPKLGAATLIGLVVTGQIITSLVLDHYGLFGFPMQKISVLRVFGALLLIAGVVLIRKF